MMNKPEKVDVVILGSAHPLRGGLSGFNHRLAKAYIDRGFTVRIITFSLQYPAFLFPGKTQYSDEPPPEGLDIEVRLNSVNPWSWLRVGKYIKRLNPGYLIVKFWIPFMGPALGTVAGIARKNGTTKVVSIIDNIIPHEKRPGDRLLAQYFVNRVDGFITMSQAVLNDLRTFSTDKPAIFTPHPVYDNFGNPVKRSLAARELELDEHVPYLLFFGFIRDYKGLDLLLEAMADERIARLGVKAIIAGEFYTDDEPYQKIIREHKLHERLIMATDFIPDSRVALYFSVADLLVQPYKEATQSGVTQVAYHFEKPMVVTRVGGLPEIVPHQKAGYVVDVSPKAIADAIVDFYKNNRAASMIASCRREKKKYQWETLLQKIDELWTPENDKD